MMNRVFLTAVAACAFCVGGRFYGGARSMQESVGFDLGVSLMSLLPGALVAALGIALAGLVAECAGRRSWRVAKSVAVAVLVPMLVASLVAEAWILVDEARFEQEVEAVAARPYSRARAWPNEMSALVYRPEYGITATD